VLATASVVLAGLVIIAGFTIATVSRSSGVSAQNRGHAQALHAAEAGVEAAAAFLHDHFNNGNHWQAYVAPPDINGDPVGVSVAAITGNGVAPGQPGNPFDATALAWYEITLFNNRQDPGFAIGEDQDGVIIIQSTGHGPDGARVVLEVQAKQTAADQPITRQSWQEKLN
jgi:hypothetical protein